MYDQLPENLTALADVCPKPLYVVGGSVRDFLAGRTLGAHTDWDLSSPMSEEEFLAAAERCGFTVNAVYRNTGTVKLQDPCGCGYEFSRFRSDTYVRGEHVPSSIEFTEDISLDAKRRDFCANAVYYDIRARQYVDPLGGVGDIGRKVLRTVREAERVFGEDGLRLMRLARIAAETGFSPDEAALEGARLNRALLDDIAAERLFAELRLILYADKKEGTMSAPYRGLCILRETKLMERLLPELALGEGMKQRSDFHDHDVLEHSLRCVLYAPSEIRFAALFHDVGKPFCMLRDGRYHAHAEEGERITREIFARLKAPKALTEETAFLVSMHMRDLDLKMRDAKVRRDIVRCGPLFEKLLLLKQADYTACKDDPSPAPTVVKWKRIAAEMRAEGAPFSLRELAVHGTDLQALGIVRERTADALALLFDECVADGRKNRKETLLAAAARLPAAFYGRQEAKDGGALSPLPQDDES